MADDDLSNELLELAGQTRFAKASSGPRSTKSRKRRRQSDNDDLSAFSEDDSVSSTGNDIGPSSSASVAYLDGTQDDDDDDDDEFKSLYPLEGKYRDEEDRERLLGLPEVEREQILYEREEELQALQEKRDLAARLRQQQKGQAVAQSSERRSVRDAVSVTAASQKVKLEQLRKRRQNKTAFLAQQQSAHRDESTKFHGLKESEGSSDEGEVEIEDDDIEEKDAELGRQLSLEDVNSIRITRSQLAKFCFHPLFEAVVQGCFVRINLGTNRQQQPVYQLFQIRGLVQHRAYTFEDRTVDLALDLAAGSGRRVFEMSIVSNSKATEEELDKYLHLLDTARLRPTSRNQIQRKKDDLLEMVNYKLTEPDITAMVEKRKSLQKVPANITVEKQALKVKHRALLEAGKVDEARLIEREILHLETIQTQKVEENDMLTKVNERNRKKNIDEIRKAELKAIIERRRQIAEAAAGANNHVTSNPFSRVRTNPRTFYENISRTSSPAPTDATTPTIPTAEQPEPVASSTSTPSNTLKKKATKKEVLIANTDFGLDLDL